MPPHLEDRCRFEPLEPRVYLDGQTPTLSLFSPTPAFFAENQGQWADASVRYALRGSGANVLCTDNGPIFQVFQREDTANPEADGGLGASDAPSLEPSGAGADRNVSGTQFTVSFQGANATSPVGLDRTGTVYNYFVGEASTWRQAVPSYGTVAYLGLYEGIDLYGSGSRTGLKYEFHVAPGADCHAISVTYTGVNALRLDAAGALHIETPLGELIDDAPFIYQEIDGQQVAVDGTFCLTSADTCTFVVNGDYDPGRELVIDPNLAWGSFLGGSGADYGNGIAADPAGNIFVTGKAESANFPTPGGFDSSLGGLRDAFVAKVTASGTLAWATFLGGGSDDWGEAIAADADGNAFVTGYTNSADFPTPGGFNKTMRSGDAFVAKVTGSGTLAWASYLGGSQYDYASDVAVNAAGDAWVTGYTNSSDFPTPGGFNTTFNGDQAFVVRVTASGNLAWGSFLGGNGYDYAYGIAVDPTGNALVAGYTMSSDLATPGVSDRTLGGARDAFVAKVTPSGNLAWATYIGGSDNEWAYDIAADRAGNAWIVGETWSRDLPTPGGFDTGMRDTRDAFVAKVTPAGNLAWASYLGGGSTDQGFGIATTPAGSALVTGKTWSNDFPVPAGFDTTYNAGGDAFVAEITSLGDLGWASFLGGKGEDYGNDIAADPAGNGWVTGCTLSSDFPTPGGFNRVLRGTDAFVVKITGTCTWAPPVPFEMVSGGILNGQMHQVLYGPTVNYACPVLGDVDGDGDKDLLVGGKSGSLLFFLNQGTSQFPSYVPQERTDLKGRAPALVDIDGDGDLDLFVGNDNGFRFYRNDDINLNQGGSDSTLSQPQWVLVTDSYIRDWTSCSCYPAFADIDADGDIDLFVAVSNQLSGENRLYFYENTAAPVSPQWRLASDNYLGLASLYSSDSMRPAFADIDGDGDLDLFIGDLGGNIRFWENVGTPQSASWFLRTDTYAGIHPGGQASPLFVDMDGDGDLDLVAGNALGDVPLYENVGTPASASWREGRKISTGLSAGHNAGVAFDDYDKDGDPDLLLMGSYSARLFENGGSPAVPAWEPSSLNVANSGFYRPQPCFADINNDGDKELFVGWSHGIAYYHRDANGYTLVTTEYVPISNPLGLEMNLDPTLVDIDGDGDLDLFAYGMRKPVGEDHWRPIFLFFRNVGTPSQPAWQLVDEQYLGALSDGIASEGLYPPSRSPVFADIDHDGDYDLLVGKAGGVRLYRNVGTPTSAAWQLEPFSFGNIPGAEDMDLALVDIDGDGNLDVFVGYAEGGVSLFLNQSERISITPRSATVVSGRSLSFTVQDVSPGTEPISWILVRNGSGGNLDPNTGAYTAGTVSGAGQTRMDWIEARGANGMIGRAYVNVISAEDVSAAGKAILVAGRRGPGDSLWNSTNSVANFVYQTLLYRGFSKENVYYLSPDPNQDVDGNGVLDDIDAASSLANVAYAFHSFAAGANSLTVCLVDHGGADPAGVGQFQLGPSEILTADTLDGWLDTLQSGDCRVTTVIDCCESGSFLDELAAPPGKERIVITSTTPDKPAYFIANGLISFSEAFFNSIYSGYNVMSAFEVAAGAMSAFQTPLLDDTGDGLYDRSADGHVAEQRYIGSSSIVGADRPQVGRTCANQVIESGTEATIWADQVSGAYPILRVWAVVVPPSFAPDSQNAGDPIASLPQIELLYNEAADRWESTYDGFTESGAYTIILFAQDIWNSISIPKQTNVVQAGFDEKVILVAGNGAFSQRASWDATNYMANYAYRTFLNRWFDKADIYYLNPDTAQDVDGNNQADDVDGQPTLANLQYAINTWAAQADRLTLYLVGNGTAGGFRLNDSEVLAPSALESLLNGFQAQQDRQVTVVLDASCSGGWLSSLAPPADKKRVLIASTPANKEALCAADGRVSFSQFFLSQVLLGRNLKDAFRAALDATTFVLRTSDWDKLDDNGNGLPNEKPGDGALAKKTHIGSAFVTGGDLPLVASVCPDMVLESGTAALLWAQGVSDADGISRVWAAIVPPHYSPETGAAIASADLTFNPQTQRYEVLYDRFRLPGAYRLLIYAEDTEHNIAEPAQAVVTQAGADPYENDDGFLAASPIVVDGDAQLHNFHDAGDADWVKFFGMADTPYAIQTSGLGPRADTVIHLYDSDGTTLLIKQDSGEAGEDETLWWSISANGVYYVEVRPFDGAVYGLDTDYELRVYRPLAPQFPGFITGTVRDSMTNVGISGAAVVLGGGGSAITNPDGMYALAAPEGTYTLTVSAKGYEVSVRSGVVVLPLQVLEGQNAALNPAVPPEVTSAMLNAQAARGVSQVDPSGAGVAKIVVTFSKAVTWGQKSVEIAAVDFSGGQEQLIRTLTPADISGSGTDRMTATFAPGAVVDTWVKVTLKAGTIADGMGNALDGDMPLTGSRRVYLYSEALDLPSGDGQAGGDAVFYVGSLRGDFNDDGSVTADDKAGFMAAWNAKSLDADFHGVGFGVRPPDGKITLGDIDGFTSVYRAAVAAGRHLDPLLASIAPQGQSAIGQTQPEAGATPIDHILAAAAGMTPFAGPASTTPTDILAGNTAGDQVDPLTTLSDQQDDTAGDVRERRERRERRALQILFSRKKSPPVRSLRSLAACAGISTTLTPSR